MIRRPTLRQPDETLLLPEFPNKATPLALHSELSDCRCRRTLEALSLFGAFGLPLSPSSKYPTLWLSGHIHIQLRRDPYLLKSKKDKVLFGIKGITASPFYPGAQPCSIDSSRPLSF